MKKNLYFMLSAIMLAAVGMLLTGCDSSSESSDGYIMMPDGVQKIGGKIWLDNGPNGAKYTFYDADRKQITTFYSFKNIPIWDEHERKWKDNWVWVTVDIGEEKIDPVKSLSNAVYYMVENKTDNVSDRFYAANMNPDKDTSYTWTYYDPNTDNFKSEYIAMVSGIGGGKVNTKEIMENNPQYIYDNSGCDWWEYVPATVWKGLDDFRKDPERNEGYTDWFIPSRDELSTVVSVLGDFNGFFKNVDVWSSSGHSVRYGDAYMWWQEYEHMDPIAKTFRGAKLFVVRSF